MPREPLTFAGVSVAGLETSIEVPSLRLVLDMGRCTNTAVNQRYVVLSHGHLDHIGAIAQHAARRALMKMQPGIYLVPDTIHPIVERLFNAAGDLDGHPIPREVIPLQPGEDFPLPGGRFVRPFATFHRVPSQGYTVWERRRRLRAEFQNLPGPELARLRAEGVTIDEPHDFPLLAFSGDTRIEALEHTPELSHVDTLVIETSFLDQRVSVPEAREMGHIHLDEVIARHDLFQNRDVVFTHFSARYSSQDITQALTRLPPNLRERTRPFPPHIPERPLQ
ncbi:MAG: MBL fold metallo-hydrolase [Myxococcota bacterium]